MNHTRSYPKVIRRWYRPLEHACPECHRTLREAVAVSRRTVITLDGVIKLNHAGYRCPDVDCPGHQRTYRSPVADALALLAYAALVVTQQQARAQEKNRQGKGCGGGKQVIE